MERLSGTVNAWTGMREVAARMTAVAVGGCECQ